MKGKLTNMLQLYTANILYVFFIHLHCKWRSSSFRLHQSFPKFDGPNTFFPQILQVSGPNFRQVGKSLSGLKCDRLSVVITV